MIFHGVYNHYEITQDGENYRLPLNEWAGTEMIETEELSWDILNPSVYEILPLLSTNVEDDVLDFSGYWVDGFDLFDSKFPPFNPRFLEIIEGGHPFISESKIIDLGFDNSSFTIDGVEVPYVRELINSIGQELGLTTDLSPDTTNDYDMSLLPGTWYCSETENLPAMSWDIHEISNCEFSISSYSYRDSIYNETGVKYWYTDSFFSTEMILAEKYSSNTFRGTISFDIDDLPSYYPELVFTSDSSFQLSIYEDSDYSEVLINGFGDPAVYLFTNSSESIGIPEISSDLLPGELTNLIIDNETQSSLEISWDYTDNATKYGIIRWNSNTGVSEIIGNVGNRTSYQDTGLDSNTKYQYEVRAGNSYGWGGWDYAYGYTLQDDPIDPIDPIDPSDTEDPILESFSINSATTTTTSVTLSLSATDNVNVSYMRFSNDNISNWSNWEPYSNSKTWTITNTENSNVTVYAQVMDSAGRESNVRFDSVYLDAIITFRITADSLVIDDDGDDGIILGEGEIYWYFQVDNNAGTRKSISFRTESNYESIDTGEEFPLNESFTLIMSRHTDNFFTLNFELCESDATAERCPGLFSSTEIYNFSIWETLTGVSDKIYGGSYEDGYASGYMNYSIEIIDDDI